MGRIAFHTDIVEMPNACFAKQSGLSRDGRMTSASGATTTSRVVARHIYFQEAAKLISASEMRRITDLGASS
ncbi:hypothetical protein [Mesorhizobium wenxiniae]|uniref:Uncharacterized protein n=1 Tax=Mesorhizobium wenxiniae TaxID=2014805 RepID=A0A271KLM9_9HYPH|nr:hypothetical protein [Mesorhizobium wenxiniae]PAP96017.1 hypothetical protein CIT31_09590 [Mesorhizobium wenxiniae]